MITQIAEEESQLVKENPTAIKSNEDESEKQLHELLLPNVNDLPVNPTSAIEFNFVTYFAPDFMKPEHDQYIYRHANGLCVIGMAAGHVAFKDEGGVTSVDFNVGKSNRSEIKVTGKRKRNAQHFESNTALCKVCTNNTFYIVRCCIKGSLLEVNERLIKQPELLNSAADREGYVAIIMPRPSDWLKAKDSFMTFDEYKKFRQL
ncbi:Single hybrid motif-containing protein [Artemisia annua]|uniref:Single hybrid motif-containing protein n=2 Tax=Artemisia annua TaxID=35608 RepID=A0A2U1MAE2_ARTAN|nr:Single hybrid motif-containing protein [Artemisia annua]